MRSSPWLTLLLLLCAPVVSGAEASEWEIAGVRGGEPPEPGTVRVLFGSQGYRQPDVPGGGTMTGVSSVVAAGFSPWRRLEVEARAHASSVQGQTLAPRHVQTVGDVESRLIWREQRGALAAGAFAGARAFAGTQGTSSYGESLSPLAGVLGGLRVGPLRLSSELAFVADRSGEVVESSTTLDPARRLAWGVSDGSHGYLALGAAFPASSRIAGVAGWRSEGWAEGSSHSASAGAVARVPWLGRSFFLEGGLHVLVAGNETETRPLVPDVAGTIVLTLVAPPARSIVREVVVEPTLPSLGVLTGSVRDSESGEPLLWAIVEVPGVLDNAVVTDGTGAFRVPEVRPGAVAVRVQKGGYESASANATVSDGKDTHVEILLAPAVGRTTGAFEGFVRSRSGEPVTGATVTFAYRGESRKVGVDDKGRFKVSLPPGEFSVTVEASGFASQVRSFEVSVGRLSSFEFLLEPESP